MPNDLIGGVFQACIYLTLAISLMVILASAGLMTIVSPFVKNPKDRKTYG